jgi:hypothetical protein
MYFNICRNYNIENLKKNNIFPSLSKHKGIESKRRKTSGGVSVDEDSLFLLSFFLGWKTIN